jgi:hypothetical protein
MDPHPVLINSNPTTESDDAVDKIIPRLNSFGGAGHVGVSNLEEQKGPMPQVQPQMSLFDLQSLHSRLR